MEDEYPVVTIGSGLGGEVARSKRVTLELALFYSSAHAVGDATAAANMCLGFGWSHSYNVFLYTYQSAMFRRDQEGRITKFLRVPLTSPIRYQPTPGYFETMVRNVDGTFSINHPDGSSQKFKTFATCPYLFATPIYQMTEQRDRNGNLTSLTYDALGRLIKVSDPKGRAITFTYDGWNRIQTITDPLGRSTQLVHALMGAQLIRIIDPDNKTVDYQYDSLSRVIKKVKKNGDTFLYSYVGGMRKAEYLNPDGTRKLLAAVVNRGNWQLAPSAVKNFMADYVPGWLTNTDGRGNIWVFAYNSNAFPVTKLAPGATIPTQTTYDPVTLKPASRTDANGNTTRFAYDTRGNVIAVTNCAGHVTRYTYEPVFNQFTSMTDPNGFVTTYAYDAKGNPIRETDALGFTREWSYDATGNVLTEKDKNGNVTTHHYDALGNRDQTTDALGQMTTFAYDAVGNLLQRRDANNHTTTYTYDLLGRLVAETDLLGNTTSYGYDPESRRTRVTDANGHTTWFTYDEQDRLIRTTDALGQMTATAYDGAGNKIAETNANGFLAWYAYDLQNRLTFVTNALGGITAFSYDPVGNKISETDANGHTSTFVYDCLNRLTGQINALGCLTQFEYDAGPGGGGCGCGAGTRGTTLITKQTDANGKVTYFKYCPLGRLLTTLRKQGDTADVIDGDDAVITSSYDRNGNRLTLATRITAADYLTNAFGYDALNRPVTTANGAGEITATSYDPVGNALTVTSPNGNVTVNTYDAKDRLIQMDDTIGRVASYGYDPVGNRLSQTDGNGNCTQYSYDPLNRLIRTTDAMGQSTTNLYDPMGNLVKVIDRMDNLTEYTYDPLNRRIQTRDALDCLTTYAYDAVGNLLCVTDANGHSTCYEYDAANRKLKETYPDLPKAGEPVDSNKRFFTYDCVGNVTSRTDQKGVTTIYGYSDLYYLLQRDYPTDADDTFTYDLAGRMFTAEKGGWLVTFAYDGAHRVIQTTQGGRFIGCLYNTPGRTRTLLYPGGRVITETQDARGRLWTVNDGGVVPIATYTYDLGNRVLTRIYRNGVVADYDYNPNDWITSLRHTVPPAPGVMGIMIAGFDYAYDKEGNKLCQADLWNPDWSEAYRYDPLYRLTNFARGNLVNCAVPSPGKVQDWQLDCLGNWNTTTVDGVPENRTHNEANEITGIQESGGAVTAVQHDYNGNLINDGRYAYAYDQEHRLVQATRLFLIPGDLGPRLVGQYTYDALGRRIHKLADPDPAAPPSAVVYLHDDNRVVEEQTPASATLATYTFGNYIDEVLAMDRAGQTLYYQQNALWSVVAVADAAGGPVERYHYDGYGNAVATDPMGIALPLNLWGSLHSLLGNHVLFTGRQLDEETALHYYRARHYTAALSCFLERDSFGYGQGMNLYEYVKSSPSVLVDPYGLRAKQNRATSGIRDILDPIWNIGQKIKEGIDEFKKWWDRIKWARDYKKAQDKCTKGQEAYLKCLEEAQKEYDRCPNAPGAGARLFFKRAECLKWFKDYSNTQTLEDAQQLAEEAAEQIYNP